jgi:hypothetical protein
MNQMTGLLILRLFFIVAMVYQIKPEQVNHYGFKKEILLPIDGYWGCV